MIIGILGTGQLGRMLALAGYPLGFDFVFAGESLDTPVKNLGKTYLNIQTDQKAFDAFINAVDVVTYEFENVDINLANKIAALKPIHPNPQALAIAQDRLQEKSWFRQHKIATADYVPVTHNQELIAAEALGFPLILKTARMGYDGKGQCVVEDISSLQQAWNTLGQQACIAEKLVAFKRELSIIATADQQKNVIYYPLTENTHREGILRTSIAPAPNSVYLQQTAQQYIDTLIHSLNYVGTIALELFETTDGKLLANEMAPRVHNSGHWTIEGSTYSQFENHIRAVAGLPLGEPRQLGEVRMENIIGKYVDLHATLSTSNANVHLYGKIERINRKLGHVTYLK